MTLVEMQLWDMGWGRRIVMFALATIGFLLLGIALSAALARPAAAATLPVPGTPALTAAVPSPVTSALGAVGDVTHGSGVVTPVSTLPSNAINGVTGGIAPLPTVPTNPLPIVPGAPLPTLPIMSLPIPALALPGLPVITRPTTVLLPTHITPAGTSGAGPVPGIGGAAHGSAGTHRGSSSRGSATGGALLSSISHRSGAPTGAPMHGLPLPSFPLIPGSAGDTAAPGHGNTPWNAVPLTILLLTALGLGGVFLRRRLGLKPLFDSRLAPPG